MKKVLLGMGGAAGLAAVVIGVGGVSGMSSAETSPAPDPSLPTLFTNPQTQIVNGDGSRVDCVAIDQALSCPGWETNGRP